MQPLILPLSKSRKLEHRTFVSKAPDCLASKWRNNNSIPDYGRSEGAQ